MPASEAPTRPPRGASDPCQIVEIGEVYLELAALDLQDEQAILGFVNRFGPLGVGEEKHAALRGVPGFADLLPDTQTPDTPGIDRAVSESGESIEEFRLATRCIRDAITARRVLEGDEDTAAWQSLPTTRSWFDPEPSARSAITAPAQSARNEAALALSRILNPALQRLHPELLLDTASATPETSPHGPPAPLYAICCLELYNHIIEHAQYRICPLCHRRFVRQRGRAHAGHFKSDGIIYCSAHCAKTEASRRYRARNKAAHHPSTKHRPRSDPPPSHEGVSPS